MRTWSTARVQNAPKVAANAVLPSACRPVWAPTIACSAMYICTKRSGASLLEVLGMRGVADLAIEHDEVGAMTGEPSERLAERLAGGDRLGVDGRGLGAELTQHERLELRR